MANNPQFQMSFQNEAGQYWTAQLNDDGTHTVTNVVPQTFLNTIAKNWDNSTIAFNRDPDTLGIFRSLSSGNFTFADDARAILQFLKNSYGVQAFCTFTIWRFDDSSTTWQYTIWYKSQLDFSTFKPDYQNYTCEIASVDNYLFRDLQAYKDTQYNVPMYVWDGTDWVLPSDINYILHPGIKLLYQASYSSLAQPTNQLNIQLEGFNQGRHGSGPNKGVHTIPELSKFIVTQNNGETTFIGNTILNSLLIQGNQIPGAAAPVNEVDFSGTNNSQPYTRQNFSLSNKIIPPYGFYMSVVCSFTFFNGATINYNDNGNGCFIGFVMFEIDAEDNPVIVATRYTYTMIAQFNLPPSLVGSVFTPPYTAQGNVNAPVNVFINPNKVYIFAYIYDESISGGGLSGDGSKMCNTILSDLTFSFSSLYDGGQSGVPLPAPMLNASAFPSMNINSLMTRLVPFLATRNSDAYGFPVPVSTAYTFKSNFLSDPTVLVQDVCPAQIQMTSAYCIHDLQGQPFITASISNVFDLCKKQLGCGASIEYDSSGNPTIYRIEYLAYFFDNTTMILDFGYEISNPTSEPLVDGLGANIKAGYTAQDLNSNFGTEYCNTNTYYDTPLSQFPNTMDFECDTVLCEMYALEIIRAQTQNQPIGTAIVPGNPSNNNQLCAFYCYSPTDIPHSVIIPDYPTYPFNVYNPANVPNPAQTCILPVQRSNAQSTDPTAATAPYISGFKWPDTVINMELSPGRAWYRGTGAYLHSILDAVLNAYSLIFRNTYQMQYNNSYLGVDAPIQSNLVTGGSGAVITEFKDIAISSLPAQLFTPVLWKIHTTYPANMYSIIQNNPRGYVRFFIKDYYGKGYGQDKEVHGFIMSVSQTANGSATDMVLLGTPDAYGRE